jgi:dihydroorotase
MSRVSTLLIQNGRILDPGAGIDRVGDLWIVGGRVADGPNGRRPDATIDATGKLVVPGLIDMHVHLREPGREDKETIATGTRAAAAGGFTTICPMPNTQPVIDSQTGVKFILSRAQSDAVVNVLPYAAVTRGQAGEEMTEFGDLIAAGAIAFTDDGRPIMNNNIMRRALEYSSMFDAPVLDHCEDLNLAGEGCMHEGRVSTELGLVGWPSAAESVQVERDVDLAAFTGGRVHICHVSVAESVAAVRHGKKRGVRITCEVTPHHLTLTDEAVRGYNANARCNPPLASEADRRALVAGLLDGTIDVIATDHAPHTPIEKDLPFAETPNGVIGVETAFAVLNALLIRTGEIPLETVIEKMTAAPARVLGLKKGTLAPGADGDVAVLDPDAPTRVEPERFHSKARNSPWSGRELFGRVAATIVGGRIVFRDGEIVV